jgi:hypothetical protein
MKDSELMWNCRDCEWRGSRDQLGEDDGGAIHYCPECSSMYLVSDTFTTTPADLAGGAA